MTANLVRVDKPISNEELILTTIKKVYAIREGVERRAVENSPLRAVPIVNDIAFKLSSTALSKDQLKDISAFVTASCPNDETLKVMEKVSAYKSQCKVNRPLKVWLSYVGLIFPMLLVIMAEIYMGYTGVIVQMPYLIGTFLVIILAIIISVVLFAYLGYDPVYRRDSIEIAAWKAINDECLRMGKKNGTNKKHVQLLSSVNTRN